MANIQVQKEVARPAPPTIARGWDPFRTMRELLRWDPFSEFAPTLATEEMGFEPAFEVKETPNAYVFRADLPGMKSEDLDVKLAQNRLTVSGKREAEKREKTDTYYTYERSYGHFMRSFTLPEGVESDKVDADLKDGVLTLTLPKKPEVQPRQVQVKSK